MTNNQRWLDYTSGHNQIGMKLANMIGDMKEIIIQNSSKTILVDDEDFERLNKHKWYCVGNNSNHISIIRTKTFCFSTKNYPIGKEIIRTNLTVDHVDRNPFNNQKSNLRIADRSQNAMNVAKRSSATSKYKGVRLTKKGMWEARISAYNKTYQIGTYPTEKEAALAYNKKAEELHKEFGVLNKI